MSTWRREAAARARMASARCGTITPTAKVRRASASFVSLAVAVWIKGGGVGAWVKATPCCCFYFIFSCHGDVISK